MRSILLSWGVLGLCTWGLAGCGRDDTTPSTTTVPVKPPVWIENPLPVAAPVGDPIENSIGMVLVPIPAGEFYMGRYLAENITTAPPRGTTEVYVPRNTVHRVKISKSFYLGQTEVTRRQWTAVMKTTPWQGQDEATQVNDSPATSISWTDAVNFCRKLTEREGVEYRLPTEAEWEYACRAGTNTRYSFGDDVSRLSEYAWFKKDRTVPVGQLSIHAVAGKKANAWNLYDMHGNVYEWCQDWHGDYTVDDLIDPLGPPSQGNGRVLRGGSFLAEAHFLTSAHRNNRLPANRDEDLGFRVVRTIVE